MSDCNCGSSFRRYSAKVRNFVTVILERLATVVSGFSTIPDVLRMDGENGTEDAVELIR
jgi:hypothetical protein